MERTSWAGKSPDVPSNLNYSVVFPASTLIKIVITEAYLNI